MLCLSFGVYLKRVVRIADTRDDNTGAIHGFNWLTPSNSRPSNL